MKHSDLVFAVDPGHGGDKTGAVTSSGIREADLALRVALAAQRKMRWLLLTRCEDTWIPYEIRARAMVAFSVSFIVLIHFDASSSRGRHGLDAYYYTGNGMTRAVGRWAINNAPVELARGRLINAQSDQGTPGARYLTEVYPMDTLLLEMGYLTNENDFKYVTSPRAIDELSDLVIGCCNHYRFILKGKADGES